VSGYPPGTNDYFDFVKPYIERRDEFEKAESVQKEIDSMVADVKKPPPAKKKSIYSTEDSGRYIDIISERLNTRHSEIVGYLIINGLQRKFRLEIPANDFYWQLYVYSLKKRKWKIVEEFAKAYTSYQYRDRSIINSIIFHMDRFFDKEF
jgi:hypothetical protein